MSARKPGLVTRILNALSRKPRLSLVEKAPQPPAASPLTLVHTTAVPVVLACSKQAPVCLEAVSPSATPMTSIELYRAITDGGRCLPG